MHEAGYGKTEEAKALLQLTYRLSIWFMEVYGDWDFQAHEYIEPQEQPALDTNKLQQEYEEKVKKLEQEYEEKEKKLEDELETIRQKAETEQVNVKTERKKISKNFMRRHQLTEAETRTIIDGKLRTAGWEVDTTALNHHKNGTLPEKNRNMAIAEWKVAGGRVDYALFIGLKLVGFIEAKAKKKTIPSALESQAKVYAKHVVQVEDEVIIPTTSEYKVPFLYATNG